MVWAKVVAGKGVVAVLTDISVAAQCNQLASLIVLCLNKIYWQSSNRLLYEGGKPKSWIVGYIARPKTCHFTGRCSYNHGGQFNQIDRIMEIRRLCPGTRIYAVVSSEEEGRKAKKAGADRYILRRNLGR